MGRDRRRLLALIGLSSLSPVFPKFIFPATFGNTNTFHAASIAGPLQTITAAKFNNSNTFFASITQQGRVIEGGLFTNTQTFHASTVSRGTMTISSSLFVDSDSFHASTVQRGVLAISGGLFSSSATFHASTVAIGAIGITANKFSNTNTFYASQTSHTSTLDSFTLDVDSLAEQSGIPTQTITGALFTNSNTFQAATATNALNIFGVKFNNTNTFEASTVGRGVRNINAVKFNNAASFKTAVIGTSGGGLPVFPNASNTGVPVGTALTNSGSLSIGTPGTIIENLNITGTIIIDAANVTIRYCKINGTTSESVIHCNPAGTNLTMHDCELDGNTAWNGINTRGGTFTRINAYACENVFNFIGNNITLIDCYLHDVQGQAGAHHDTIECNGGTSGHLIDHCNIINEKDETAAVMLNNWAGGLSNVTVQNCRLVGGGYTCYCDNTFGGGPVQGSTIRFLNNRMLPGFWGYFSLYSSGAVTSGNVNDITGASVD